jgi:NAD(P)-dependent dehydrogenase (short-subunit alcohol dehydrogenase family)
VRDAVDRCVGQDRANEVELASAGLAVLHCDAKDGAVSLSDEESSIVLLRPFCEIPVLVQNARELGHLGGKVEPVHAREGALDPPVPAALEDALDQGGIRIFDILEELVGELRVGARIEGIGRRGQAEHAPRPARAGADLGERDEPVALERGDLLPGAGNGHSELLGKTFGGHLAPFLQDVQQRPPSHGQGGQGGMCTRSHFPSLGRRGAFNNKETFFLFYSACGDTFEVFERRSRMDRSLVALVTGSSRGIGRALARALAERGWNLVLDARGADPLEQTASELRRLTHVVAVPGDVGDERHRIQVIDAARSLGGLDLLINNAGVLGVSPQPRLADYPIDVLERAYRINVFAPLRLFQLALPLLEKSERGTVVNVTSDAATGAYEMWGGYGSAKAALEQISNVMAAEHPNLRILWVDPGSVRTRMHQEAYPGDDISDRPHPDDVVPGFVGLLDGDYPSGRYEAASVAAPAGRA